MEDVSIEAWIDKIHDQYPHLPNRLTAEIENRNLDRLQDWRARVEKLREDYDKADVPDELKHLPGGRLVIPAVMSVEDMTDDEIEAWHELFACVAAQMAKMAHKYWRAHSKNGQNSLVLADILDYLPIVFLYVLSSYEADRGNEHEDDFSSDGDRIRLTTWISIEGRRHINKYLQTCAYVIGRGSSYLHRLRGRLRQIKNEKYVQDGEYPSRQELIDEIEETTYYGKTVSRRTLNKRVSELEGSYQVVSTDAPAGKNEDESFTYGDMVSDYSQPSQAERLDGFNYILGATEGKPNALQSACLKILRTNEPLTVEEQYYF